MFDEIYTYSDIEELVQDHILFMEDYTDRSITADMDAIIEELHDYCQAHGINFDDMPTAVFEKIVDDNSEY